MTALFDRRFCHSYSNTAFTLSSTRLNCQQDQCRVILNALRNHAGLRTRNYTTLIVETRIGCDN